MLTLKNQSSKINLSDSKGENNESKRKQRY